MTVPLKPPMPYAGGKQAIAQAIADLLPPHKHYVEPFAGAMSVLLAKAPSRVETVNDLNEDIVTFWRILRDRPDDLARVCSLTPHSRAELRAAIAKLYTDERQDLDELERARCIWVVLTQRRSAATHPSAAAGWRFVAGGGGRAALARYLQGYVDRLAPAAERIRRVSLECRPALDLIRDYGQHADVCLYVDPPYLGDTRGSVRLYRHEMDRSDDHAELLTALLECRSAVVLSGYDHPLYGDLLASWHVHRFSVIDQRGSDRTEVVWSNRALQGGLW